MRGRPPRPCSFGAEAFEKRLLAAGQEPEQEAARQLKGWLTEGAFVPDIIQTEKGGDGSCGSRENPELCRRQEIPEQKRNLSFPRTVWCVCWWNGGWRERIPAGWHTCSIMRWRI